MPHSPFDRLTEALRTPFASFRRVLGGLTANDGLPTTEVDRIHSYDFGSHSDESLRRIISRCVHASKPTNIDDLLPLVFAVVDEAVKRRLGIWRMFDSDFMSPLFNKYRTILKETIDSRKARTIVDHSTDANLDSDDSTILQGLIHVTAMAQRTESTKIMLPGSFYRALRRKGITQEIQFRPTDEQLMAGCLLFEGKIVEMGAGEGKTIAAVFPAVLHSVLGKLVHVITANDYLASRDVEFLAPVYESLGLTVRAVFEHMSDRERAHAYSGHVLYGTLREIGFDFLRDNLKLSEETMVQRQLDVAIVDEADQSMIDEAHSPMIIAAPGHHRWNHVHTVNASISTLLEDQKAIVLGLVQQLDETENNLSTMATLHLADPGNQTLVRWLANNQGKTTRILAMTADGDQSGTVGGHLSNGLLYIIDQRADSVTLTTGGRERLEDILGPIFDTADMENSMESLEMQLGMGLTDKRRRLEVLRNQLSKRYDLMAQVNHSLHAHVMLLRDVDYIISDCKVVIVDDLTGRLLPNTKYQNGLQSAIESKEDVPLTDEPEVTAQLSVQGIFDQYQSLCGMTGTATGAADDFRLLYNLDVVVVPPSLQSKRADLPSRLYTSVRDKHQSVVDQVRICRRVGRPVLIGTTTVAKSKEISSLLKSHGIDHHTLNANSSDDETRIVEAAGRAGAVTVATNMAGRGTDIVLESGLDHRIVNGYLSLIKELLDENHHTVSLTCVSLEEAQTLHNTLSRRFDIKSELDIEASTPLIKVSRTDQSSAEKVTSDDLSLEFGMGLYIIGTELNQSNRTDLQLRGRAARQGQLGGTKFIVSLEDRPLLDSKNATSHRYGESRHDDTGHLYYEGPSTTRRIRHSQIVPEMDDHAVRKTRRDLDRLIERQTAAYYRKRHHIMRSSGFRGTCARLASECASRLVDVYIPPKALYDYSTRFASLSEAMWIDFSINCDQLWGLGAEQSKVELTGLMTERILLHATDLPLPDFEQHAKRLFLRTADQAWQEYLALVNGLVAAIQTGAPNHTTAVSDFARNCVDEYAIFSNDMVDRFILRLIGNNPDLVQGASTQDLNLVEDAEQILV